MLLLLVIQSFTYFSVVGAFPGLLPTLRSHGSRRNDEKPHNLPTVLPHTATILAASPWSSTSDDRNKQSDKDIFAPPPPPENTLVLTGDLVAIFVYGFTDHFISQDLTQAMVTEAANNPTKLQALAAQVGDVPSSLVLSANSDGSGTSSVVESLVGQGTMGSSSSSSAITDSVFLDYHHIGKALSSLCSSTFPATHPTAIGSTPVWMDHMDAGGNLFYHSAIYQHLVTAQLQDHLVAHYSPLIQPTGAATCLLASCWLLAGLRHESFSWKHTLDCPTTTALTVTAKTWLTSSLLCVMAIAASHSACGCANPLGSFTKGDVTYIIDSLSVLTMWRFLASSMLGYGSDDDEDDDATGTKK